MPYITQQPSATSVPSLHLGQQQTPILPQHFNAMSFSAMRSIPVVDLSPFTRGGSLEERQKASKSLCKACEDIGAANILGHGIPASLIEEAFSWNKKLFDLPHDEKMKAPHPAEPMPHRGYSATGVEKVYSKDDLEKDKEGTSLRDIKDYKVCGKSRIWRIL